MEEDSGLMSTTDIESTDGLSYVENPAPSKNNATRRKKIVVAFVICLLIFLESMVLALWLAPFDAEELHTTPEVEVSSVSNSGGSTKHPITPLPQTAMTITTAVTAFTPAQAVTTKSFTIKTTTLKARSISKKPILCTLKNKIHPGLADGVCEIILFNNFYAPGNGSFVDKTPAVFQWFLDYAKSYTGLTEYGIGIEHGKELDAYNDLNTPDGEAAIKDFWSLRLRHYGLLNFPVHDSLMPDRTTATNYDKLLKRLRILQEVNRAGAVNETGYLILGIGLYSLHTGKVHDYLKDLLQSAPIDVVVIRTHYDHSLPRNTCVITGPSLYQNPLNQYEVSMVEALDYVNNRTSQFKGHSLAVSFSLAVLQFTPTISGTGSLTYKIGRPCSRVQQQNITFVCEANTFPEYIRDRHLEHSVVASVGAAVTYDIPLTLRWKLCESTKRYPGLLFGVALFGLEFEDSEKLCTKIWKWKYAAGFWRTNEVSSFMKSVIRDPNFNSNTIC